MREWSLEDFELTIGGPHSAPCGFCIFFCCWGKGFCAMAFMQSMKTQAAKHNRNRRNKSPK